MRFSLRQWPFCMSMRSRTLSSLIPTQQGPIRGAPFPGALWEVPCILQTGRPCRVYCGIRGVKGAAAGGSGGSWGRGSHGKGPPKAWNAGEVSRGWCGGNQRSSPGMEQVLLCSPSGIKDVTRLKRLVLALQSETPPPNTHTRFFWLRTCESGCRSESEGWLPCSGVQRSLFVPEWAPKEERSMANAQSKVFRSVTGCLQACHRKCASFWGLVNS